MRYCKINGVEYPAIEFLGRMMDSDWDQRETKVIHLEMTYDQAIELFVDGCAWSIVDVWEEDVMDPETGEIHTVPRREEYDNSDFNIGGPITDNRDGTLFIKMGKETDLEEAYELLYGGEE